MIDHYDGNGWVNETFKQRYLVDSQYFDIKAGAKVPILFYAGNEGEIWTFYNNTGFMTETLAKEHKALVVFAEHRYFGESLPYGDKSFTQDNVRYLTVEQAMFDYVELLKQVQADYKMEGHPVIVFGGSYGGMLAAWLRMKFPHYFHGALAASAPILFFKDAVNPYAFNQRVTDDYRSYNVTAPIWVQKSFNLLIKWADD